MVILGHRNFIVIRFNMTALWSEISKFNSLKSDTKQKLNFINEISISALKTISAFVSVTSRVLIYLQIYSKNICISHWKLQTAMKQHFDLNTCTDSTLNSSISSTHPRPTQPSIPPGYINQVPAWLDGVNAGCVHFCQLPGNTLWCHMASDIP